MASAVIGGVAAVGKEVWCYLYPKINNIVKFRSNFELLKKETENLMITIRSVKEQAEAAKASRRTLALEVVKWLEDFEKIEEKVDLLKAKIEAEAKCYQTCFSHHLLGSKVAKYLIEVNRLVENGKFPSGLVVENFEVGKVEHIPGPSIVNQSTASKNLRKVLDLLNNDDVNIIGVWGMGGVGKTTLVKNLNNILEASDSGAQFSIIMWATASKNADLRNLQSQLLQRLNLEEKRGESMESTASRLHQRLKQQKKFLFILDDVWDTIDLYYLGLSALSIGNKVVLTTRSMDVCRQMKTDIEVRLDVLIAEESWELFIQNVGPVASLNQIEPIARRLNNECSGLPLAIIVVGASMRGKTNATLWNDALNAFQKSVPYVKGIEDKVYKPLMWSYDSLFFQGMNVKSCFSYCCLYPEDYSIEVDELVHCWIGEGLIEVSDNYEDSVNIGISMVEYLKDSCLLQEGMKKETVTMHDVVRDVTIWIASSLEDGCKSLVRPASGLTTIREELFQGNHKRISLMNNRIRCLPDCIKQYPQVLSLLLQGNEWPETPEGFLRGFPSLRVLNINNTFREPPNSLGHLSELRALLVKKCSDLPPLGGLLRLQVLDCSASRMAKLPEGIENLSNLRLLYLSGIKSFHRIGHGILSKLSHLEMLDMTGSDYWWDVDGEGQTPFNELQSLDHLHFLSICIKKPSSATVEFSWLERLRSFCIIVGRPRFEFVVQPNSGGKIVIFGGVCLSDKWVNSLLRIATNVVLESCLKLETLQIGFGKTCYFSAIKSLAILNSPCSFLPSRKGISEFNMSPNLEKLVLHNVWSIESVTQLMQCLGLGFSELRTLKVAECCKLSCLFTSPDTLTTPETPKEGMLSNSIIYPGLNLNVAGANEKLKASKLEVTPNCSMYQLDGEESWDQLEQVEVIDCPLTKLPFTAQNASSIKEIRGALHWWNSLEWNDPGTQSYFQSYFKLGYEPEATEGYSGEGRELCPPLYVL